MADGGGPKNLEGVLDELKEANQPGRREVSIGDIRKAIGQRAYGPLLLVPGLIALTPLGGIPTVPTILAVIVLLIAGQMLIGRRRIWLPQVLLRRSVKRERLDKSLKKARPVARFVDRFLKPRLTSLTTGAFAYVIAACCVALALIMPPLEIVPFAVMAPAAAIAAFGLALTSHDGALAVLAFFFSGVAFYFLVTGVLM